MAELSQGDLAELRECLSPLVGTQLTLLSLPRAALAGFEPSQIGTLIGVLMDACIPQLSLLFPDTRTLERLGLSRHAGSLGDREGYPDFHHSSGRRLELKLLYVDPVGLRMKRPPTPREPSARLTQKVTVKNVDAERDALLVLAYQLQPHVGSPDLFSPTIIDLGVFSMIECIRARDNRLAKAPGRWMGEYETPVILSRVGKLRLRRGEALEDTYGRKAEEGHCWNEDTNFGKLARIPYLPLRDFLSSHGAQVRGFAAES